MNGETPTWMAAASQVAGPTMKHKMTATHPEVMQVYATLAVAEALNRLAAAVERIGAKYVI